MVFFFLGRFDKQTKSLISQLPVLRSSNFPPFQDLLFRGTDYGWPLASEKGPRHPFAMYQGSPFGSLTHHLLVAVWLSSCVALAGESWTSQKLIV